MTSFRNVDVDPSRPLDEWPAEAIEILIDRGMRSDWARLIAAIEANPWGTASRTAENVASWSEHYGIDILVLDTVAQSRRSCDDRARRKYASRLRGLHKEAGLTLRELAQRRNVRVAPVGLRERQGRVDHRRARPHRARHRHARRTGGPAGDLSPGAGRRHSRGRVAPECQGREISAVALEWPVALGSPEAPRPPRSMVPPCGC